MFLFFIIVNFNLSFLLGIEKLTVVERGSFEPPVDTAVACCVVYRS